MIPMQGSHVTSQSGSYILQWRYFDSAKTSFDILSTHKSKVMYYTELLPSEQFKLVSTALSNPGFSSLKTNAWHEIRDYHNVTIFLSATCRDVRSEKVAGQNAFFLGSFRHFAVYHLTQLYIIFIQHHSALKSGGGQHILCPHFQMGGWSS